MGKLYLFGDSFTADIPTQEKSALKLTKTGNNPSTYKKEIFQHESAKDEGDVVKIGVVNDKGEIEFNSQLDTGKANEEFFKERIQKQLKTQTKDAEKQIKDKVNADSKAINKNQADSNKTDSTDSNNNQDRQGISRKNYGVLYYPAFIQRSEQDKLKITIMEFSSRFMGAKNPKSKLKSDRIPPPPKRVKGSRSRFYPRDVAAYNKKYSYKRSDKTQQIMNKFSTIRFNRYGKGQIMRQHMDHIHSLFDGNEKGIPVLSFILNLNDDYEGADLFFWENHVVPLGKGDIIMFPSLFLFPHGVTEAKKGKRYSAVSWAW